MGSSVLGESIPDPYTTEVDGRLVKCDSLSDALALKIAELTAMVGSAGPCESLTVERLIQIARKYGFDTVADQIADL